MTERKPFQRGDNVTTASGQHMVVVADESAGQPVLIESPPKAETYHSTYAASESLTRGHKRGAQADAVNATVDEADAPSHDVDESGDE